MVVLMNWKKKYVLIIHTQLFACSEQMHFGEGRTEEKNNWAKVSSRSGRGEVSISRAQHWDFLILFYEFVVLVYVERI